MSFLQITNGKYLIFAALVCMSANAEELNTVYPAVVQEVIDGDTVEVKATIWIKTYKETSVRVRGIDAPEIKSKCDNEKYLAEQAKAFVESALKNADKVYLRDVAPDKYGNRILADILYTNGEKTHNLAKELIKAELAVEYKGKSKNKDWCE